MDSLFSIVGGACYVKEGEFMEGFQEEEEEGGGQVAVEKKRRLSVQQVKSLEKNFEVENKLEPQRKLQLAKELGLQPRQVAVWFQNRRARWKTKQLEKEYGLLRLNFDSLKTNFDGMKRDNLKLAAEVASLKRRWEEAATPKAELPVKNSNIGDSNHVTGARICEQKSGFLGSNGFNTVLNEMMEGSESDSSAIFNDQAAVASPRPIDSYIPSPPSLKHSTIYVHPDNYTTNDVKNSGEDLMEALCGTKQSSNTYHIPSKLPGSSLSYNHQQCSFKVDDSEESCSFFNVDDPEAATLPWWEWV